MRLALFAALTFVAACSDPPARDPSQWPVTPLQLAQNAPTDDPAEARYRRNCLACHGTDGRGNGQTTGADFTLATGVLTKPDAELIAAVRDGRTGTVGVMPPHGALMSDVEIAAVLAYVRRTYGPTITPVVTAPTVDAAVPVDAAVAQ